jgi:hypothetical protein
MKRNSSVKGRKVNFLFLCSNVPISSAYGVYISEFIRYTRACFAFDNLLKRFELLAKILCCRVIMNLVSSYHVYVRYNDLVGDYKLSPAHIMNYFFHTLCHAVISIMALTTCNPVYLISIRGFRQMWPVSKGHLLLRVILSYLWLYQKFV